MVNCSCFIAKKGQFYFFLAYAGDLAFLLLPALLRNATKIKGEWKPNGHEIVRGFIAHIQVIVALEN